MLAREELGPQVVLPPRAQVVLLRPLEHRVERLEGSRVGIPTAPQGRVDPHLGPRILPPRQPGHHHLKNHRIQRQHLRLAPLHPPQLLVARLAHVHALALPRHGSRVGYGPRTRALRDQGLDAVAGVRRGGRVRSIPAQEAEVLHGVVVVVGGGGGFGEQVAYYYYCYDGDDSPLLLKTRGRDTW